MKPWLLFSLAALGCWGVWGLLANLASRRLDAYSAMIWEVLGAALVAAVVAVAFLRPGGLATDVHGSVFALLTGVAYTVGLVFLFLALADSAGSSSAASAGRVHSILVLTALYPFLASLLNYAVLREPITLRQLVAMGLALSALVLITTGTK